MVVLPRSVEYGDGGVEPGHEQQRLLARGPKYLDFGAKGPEQRPPRARCQDSEFGVALINVRYVGC